MAAPAKTVFVTRSSINADAMSWPSKPAQDSGAYVVDIRPLLKAEQIALGSFVVMPVSGLCVSTSSSLGGVLVLTISGGAGQVYKLQFVFSDTEGHIEVFQVSLPVGADMSCVLPNSSRAPPAYAALRVRLDQPQRRAVRRGFLDRLVCLGRPARLDCWTAPASNCFRTGWRWATNWSFTGLGRASITSRHRCSIPTRSFSMIRTGVRGRGSQLWDRSGCGSDVQWRAGGCRQHSDQFTTARPQPCRTSCSPAGRDVRHAGADLHGCHDGAGVRHAAGDSQRAACGVQCGQAKPVLFQSQVVNADGQLAVFA